MNRNRFAAVFRAMLYHSALRRRLSGLLTAVLVLGLCLAGPASPAFAANASASTVRLAKTEGSVTVKDSSGKKSPVTSNMRLKSGSRTSTGEASYAWFNLDDQKALKQDAVSEVEIRQSGKKLEVMLDSGNLFFNVKAPLQDDESLNIRTSTMVMGIRGTSGWVKVINSRVTRVFMLDGQAFCSVTNPVNGQTKSILLHAGETADFLVYEPTNPVDQCDIILRRFTRDEIEGFVLAELLGDNETIEKIYRDSGIDLRGLTAVVAQDKLAQEQQAIAKTMAVINAAFAQQSNRRAQDPVWENKDFTPQDDGDDDGGTPAPAATPAAYSVTAAAPAGTTASVRVNGALAATANAGDAVAVRVTNSTAFPKTLTYSADRADGTNVASGTLDLAAGGTGTVSFTMPADDVTVTLTDVTDYTVLAVLEGSEGALSGFIYDVQVGGVSVSDIKKGQTVSMPFTSNTTYAREIAWSVEDSDGNPVENGTMTVPAGGTNTFSFTMPGSDVNVVITDNTPLRDVSVTPATAGDLLNITPTVRFDGVARSMGMAGQNVVVSLENAGAVDRTFIYSADDTDGNNLAAGAIAINAGDTDSTISFVMPDADVIVTITDTTPRYTITVDTSTLPAGTTVSHVTSVDGTAVAAGSEEGFDGSAVSVQITNDSSGNRVIGYTVQEDGGAVLAAGTLNLAAGVSDSVAFTLGADNVTVALTDQTVYAITLQAGAEAPASADNITMALEVGGAAVTGANAGDTVTIHLTNTGAADLNLDYEIRDADGEFAGPGHNAPATHFTITAGATEDITFTMPASDLELTVWDTNTATVLHTPLTNADYDAATGALVSHPVYIRPGQSGDNSFTIDSFFSTGGGWTITLEDGVETTVTAGGTLGVESPLTIEGTLDNNGAINIQVGPLTVNGRLNNYSNIDVIPSGTFVNNGTIDNQGTVTNAGTFTNNGTVLNNAIHTFINTGTFINTEDAVFLNGPDQPGRFLNITDGTGTGTILNSGVMENAEGSIFVNEGVMVAESENAVMPELTDEEGNAVAKAGETGAAGTAGAGSDKEGSCGEFVTWKLTSPEDAVGTEGGEALELVLKGSGAMEDYEETEGSEGSAGPEGSKGAEGAQGTEGAGGTENVKVAEGAEGTSTAPWAQHSGAIVTARIDREISYLGDYSFFGLTELLKVTFTGTSDEWKHLEIGAGNEILEEVDVYCEADDTLIEAKPEEAAKAEQAQTDKAQTDKAQAEKTEQTDQSEKPQAEKKQAEAGAEQAEKSQAHEAGKPQAAAGAEQAEGKTDASTQTETKGQAGDEGQTGAEGQTESGGQTETGVQAGAEGQTEGGEAGVQAGTEGQTEVPVAAATEQAEKSQTEVQSAAGTDQTDKTQAEGQTETGDQTETGVQAGAEGQTETGDQTETGVQAGAEGQTETGDQTETGVQSGTESQTETGDQTETGVQSGTEGKTETGETGGQSGTESQTETGDQAGAGDQSGTETGGTGTEEAGTGTTGAGETGVSETATEDSEKDESGKDESESGGAGADPGPAAIPDSPAGNEISGGNSGAGSDAGGSAGSGQTEENSGKESSGSAEGTEEGTAEETAEGTTEG